MTKLSFPLLHHIGVALMVGFFSVSGFAQTAPSAGTTPQGGTASAGDATASEKLSEGGTEGSSSAVVAEQKASDTPGEGAATSESEASPPAEATALDGATYRVRLRDLEQRVDELKEQIRRSHTRLSLLSDTILAGASGGARAEIEFVNDLSGAWHLVEAVFVLDGAVQYKKTDDTGVLAKQRSIPIFSGSVPVGDHTLQVLLKLRGHGFGVFSYLRGIEASLKSDHSFTLTDGKVLELRVTAWEQGGPTTPVEEQPDIRFTSKLRAASEMPVGSPAKSSSASPDADVSAEKSSKGLGGKASVGTTSGQK
jgi:hypothetical protein